MRIPFAELTKEELESRERDGRPASNLLFAMANAPEVARNQIALLRSTTAGLEPRLVELVILQEGLISQNAYSWGHHVPVAISAGYSEEQLRALRDGDSSPFDEEDRAILDYVSALLARTVSDHQFASLRRQLGDEQLLKVTMLAGCYTMLGLAQAAIDVPQDDGFGGFECP